MTGIEPFQFETAPAFLMIPLRLAAVEWDVEGALRGSATSVRLTVFVPRAYGDYERRFVVTPEQSSLKVVKRAHSSAIIATLVLDDITVTPRLEREPLEPFLSRMTPWFRRVSTGFVELLNSGKGKLERRGLGALASSLTELLRTADLRAQRGTFGREWAVAVENDIERKKQRARLGEVKSSVVPPAMTDTEFWAALDELRARPDGLTRLSDADLYRFQLRLEKLVWELDTSALAEAVYGGPVPSGDDFVDVRLALVLAGPETYELAKAGKVTQDPGREEWLLYAAEKEWERRYGVLPQWDQPYSVETGSNPAAHSPARR